MRILHLSQRYYPVVGGAEYHLTRLSEYMATAGHEVWVATSDALDFELFWDPYARRMNIRHEIHNGVTIHRFPVRHMPLTPSTYWAVRRLMLELSRSRVIPIPVLNNLLKLTPRIPELSRWLERDAGTFDLVMGMNIAYEHFVAAGLDYAQRIKVPFVAVPMTHLGAGNRPGVDPISQYYTMRHQLALVKESQAVIAQTQAEKKFFENKGVLPANIAVGGSGVEPEEVMGGNGESFRQRHDLADLAVLSVGVMSRDKGTIDLVEAMRTLWRSGKPATLILIGHALAEFQKYYHQLEPSDQENILLLGPVDDQEKKDAFAAADLFVLPSRSESFGIVYLEAWLYGLAVIGARSWGVSDIIQEGGDGLLVPFGQPEELAASINYLLDHRHEAESMGQRGRQKVLREHTWDRKCKLALEVYESLVKGDGPPGKIP